MVSTVLRRVFCTFSRGPQEQTSAFGAKRISGGRENNDAGDISRVVCCCQCRKAFKALAPQSESFFLIRAGRRVLRFALP